jgi:CHAT domain-containing protein/tetratricopeptide (TPR) repeat protein
VRAVLRAAMCATSWAGCLAALSCLPVGLMPGDAHAHRARGEQGAVERARAQACARKTAGSMALACAKAARRPRSADAAFDLATSLAIAGNHEAAREIADELAGRADLGPWGAARLDLLRASIFEVQSQRAEAVRHFDQALAALRKRADAPPELLAEALTGYAGSIRTQGPRRASEVQALLDEAERVLVNAGLAVSHAMTAVVNQQTMLATDRDDWNLAATLALRERDLLRRLDGPGTPEQLHALTSLASIASFQRRYDDARVHLEEGLAIGRRWSQLQPDAYAGILNALVSLLPNLGRHDQALARSEEVIAFVTATWGERSPALVTPLDQRARLLESLGRVGAARDLYERLRDLLARSGTQVSFERRVRVLDMIASFHVRMNDLDTAQSLLDEFAALLPGDDSAKYWRGRWLQRTAVVAGAERRWADVDALLERAQPLLAARSGPTHAGLTYTLAMRCTAQLRSGRDARACTELQDRMPSLVHGTYDERVAGSLALGERALAEARPHDALEHHLHALAAALIERTASRRWSALDATASSLHAVGQRDLAIVFAKAAVEQIETTRQEMSTAPDLASGYLADKHAVYRRLADRLAQAGRLDEAIAVIGLLKTREYADFVRGHRHDEVAKPRDAAGVVPWRAGERRWLDASPWVRPTRDDPAAAKAAPRDEAREREGANEREHVQAWRDALARPLDTTPAAERLEAEPLEPGVLERGPPHDALHATVFLGADHVNVILESARGRRLVRTATDTAALVRDAGRLLAAIERRESVLPLLQSLHARVAKPIEDEARLVGARRASLHIDGDLRYLPFGALHDGRDYLVTRLAVQHRASRGGTLAHGDAAAGEGWLQAFGSTRAAPGLAPLRGVADELCDIVDGDVRAGSDADACPRPLRRGAVRGQGWLDAAFTAQRLREAAASGRPDRFDLLHIGSHFVLRPGEIGASWFLLGDGTRLPLHEMLRWRFESLDVVTLAACQTGVGGGAEVEGAASLLLARGVGSVVSTLWPVDDRSTSRIVADAYRHLRDSRDPAGALRHAQLRALGDRERAHPYHWAAFAVTRAGR